MLALHGMVCSQMTPSVPEEWQRLSARRLGLPPPQPATLSHCKHTAPVHTPPAFSSRVRQVLALLYAIAGHVTFAMPRLGAGCTLEWHTSPTHCSQLQLSSEPARRHKSPPPSLLRPWVHHVSVLPSWAVPQTWLFLACLPASVCQAALVTPPPVGGVPPSAQRQRPHHNTFISWNMYISGLLLALLPALRQPATAAGKAAARNSVRTQALSRSPFNRVAR